MRRTRPGPIGVDVSGRLVRLLQLSGPPEDRHLHAWSVFPRLQIDSNLRTEAPRIAAALIRRGFAGRDLAVSLPDESVLSAVLDLPPLKSGAPVPMIAAAEMERMFKQSPSSLELALWELPTTARQAGAAACMVFACPHVVADPILDAFDAHDLDIRTLEPRSASIARACRTRSAPDNSLDLVLSLGWKQSRILAVGAGIVVFERAIDSADLETLHRVVAGTIGVDTDFAPVAMRDALRAERTMLSDPDASREVQDQVRRFAETLAAEVLTTTAYLSRRFSSTRVARLLVLADGEESDDLAGLIGGRVSLESKILSLADLDISGTNAIESGAQRALPAAAGLCMTPDGGAEW